MIGWQHEPSRRVRHAQASGLFDHSAIRSLAFAVIPFGRAQPGRRTPYGDPATSRLVPLTMRLVGASDIAAFLVAASCICAAVFLILREKYRGAMLTEKSGDDAPRDRADGLWLPSHFGDQPHVGDVFHRIIP